MPIPQKLTPPVLLFCVFAGCNLSKVETTGAKETSVSLRDARFIENILNEKSYLGAEVIVYCPLYTMSALERFHCNFKCVQCFLLGISFEENLRYGLQ